MAQRKILLDTNSYLRLAREIHPLLFQEFGPDACCLYVLKELDQELSASPRLQTRFDWALELEYRENRRTQLTASKAQRKEIQNAVSFIWDYVQDGHPGPSRIDVLHMAHAFVLGLPLVSDDRDLLAVAEAFDIATMKTLDLLRLMVDCGHIQVDKMRGIVEFWRYWQDVPFGLEEDMTRLFGSDGL